MVHFQMYMVVGLLVHKQFKGGSCVALECTTKILLQGALKNIQKCEENDPFYAALLIHLIVQSRGASEGTLERAPNGALSSLHKDAQEGAFDVALKCALESGLGLHLWLHLLMQSLIYKFAQNGSFNGGPDAALEGALDGGLNVALEGAPQSSP